MTINRNALKQSIVTDMVAAGADPGNSFALLEVLADAVAKAVKEEVDKQTVQVVVPSGSSAGTYTGVIT